MATTAGNLGLKVSTEKTKGMRMNARVQENIKLNGDEIEEVDDFTYLGSKMSNTQDMGRWRSGLDLQKPARPSPHSEAYGKQGTFA